MVRRDDILDAELAAALTSGPEGRQSVDRMEALLEAVSRLERGDSSAMEGLAPHERAQVEAVVEALADWEADEIGEFEPARASVLDMVYRLTDRALSFLSGSVVPQFTPAPAPVRASARALRPSGYSEFVARFGDLSCRVSIQSLGSGALDVQLELLSGTSQGLRASLLRGKKLVESTPFHEGRVLFSGLKPDAFHVELSGAHGPVGTLRLRFVEQ